MDGADGVYPSSEDTFLLIDALTNDVEFLKSVTDGCGICLEVGCGSGEVSQALASLLPSSVCFATDVNVLAAEKTRNLVEEGEARNVNILLCDLFTGFKPGCTFDVILFNPPYVPTDEDELERAIQERDIAASWAGGKDGREVIDRFLQSVEGFLSERGVAYVVVVEFNDPGQLETSAHLFGLSATTVLKRKAGIEQLYILRFQKASGLA